MLLIQYAFVALLVGVLMAAVVSFVVMGLAKMRRTRRFAVAAHEHERRFFRDDPYDVSRRYIEFALISSGHSPRAHNVTDSRLAGMPVRAFDFRCELGHGPRRVTRHFSVAVIDAAGARGDLLMWHDSDAEFAPLAARESDGRLGAWSYRGDRALAAAVAVACKQAEHLPVSIELRGSALMVAAPAGRSASDYAVGFDDLEAIVGPVLSAGRPASAGADQS